eukprot:CAMPEP_0170488804 /NCGR_PEP_ID=MMETSP0208-20121228/7272_1 /TAXON_ID=197538 /ORGANISM="Strombidium inclinatum, Strain S3" /LENGTH=47 /DNA_ID= /DNA_START= /DNA_END= /DNA_ORIENTATION=
MDIDEINGRPLDQTKKPMPYTEKKEEVVLVDGKIPMAVRKQIDEALD